MSITHTLEQIDSTTALVTAVNSCYEPGKGERFYHLYVKMPNGMILQGYSTVQPIQQHGDQIQITETPNGATVTTGEQSVLLE